MPLIISTLLALFLSPIPVASRADDATLGPIETFQAGARGPALGDGLALRDGRTLVRGPRSLLNRYPYLIATSPAEAAERRGVELRWTNLHLLFAPLPDESAALALCRWMVGGEIVPDRAAYDRLVEVAKRQVVPEGAWEVTVHERVPERFGLAAERTQGGFAVRGTVFTTSGHAALCVVEIDARFPAGGPFTITEQYAITGPPQSWQTSGPVDEAWQRTAHRYVLGFRAAMLAVLRRDWTLETIAAAYTEGATVDAIRRRLGEPVQSIGRRGEQRIYSLADGRAVAFAATGDDAPPASATVHAEFDLDRGLGGASEALLPRR